MQHLEEHRFMFEVLKTASPKLRKAILKESDHELICVLAEIIVNLMEGNIKVSPQLKQKLSPYKNLFRKIRRQCAHPNKKKLRKSIIQVGGFLPFLLPLIPLIAKAALAGAVSTGVGLAVKKIADR